MGVYGLLQTRLPEELSGLESTVRDHPELAAAAILILVILVIGAVLILRRLRRSPGKRLKRILEEEEEIAILMHPNPDPDAMGAAIGIQDIANSVRTETTIYYPGQIRHQQNRAFQTVLDLDFSRLDDVGDIEEGTVLLVDQNRPRGFQGSETLEPDMVVDHHPGGGTGTLFTDVRTTYGSCTTIVAEYFRELGAKISEGEGPNGDPEELRLTPEVATGLMYGIMADTDHLTKGCSEAEFAASSYLYPAIDEDLLHRIANPQVTSEVLEIKATAIKDRVVNGSFAIADVGEVNDVDAIPHAAEELVQLEGISAVVIYGSKEGTIHLSGRSIDDRVHMGRTLDTVFESVPMASAGGHARMGGGQVPLSYLAGIGPKGVDEDRARSDLRGKLFNVMKGNA